MYQDDLSEIGLIFQLSLERDKLELEIVKRKDELSKLHKKIAELDSTLKQLNQKPRGRPKKVFTEAEVIRPRGRPTSEWDSFFANFEKRKQAFPDKTDIALINEIFNPLLINHNQTKINGWIKTFKNQLSIYRNKSRKIDNNS